jgi:hypothetical protein
MEFKIGDFVRHKYNNSSYVFKITSIGTEIEYSNPEETFEVLYDGEWDYRNDEPMFYRKEFCIPWIPEKGERCWFWDETNDEIIPQVRIFEKLDKHNRFQPEKSVMGFQKCEPFQGELPSCLDTKK